MILPMTMILRFQFQKRVKTQELGQNLLIILAFVTTQDMKDIKIEKLNAENFAPYGDVISVTPEQTPLLINDGNTKRFHDLAQVDTAQGGGRPLINIFRSTPLAHPVKIEKMERHPLSSQAFIPLSDNPFLVVVAPAGQFEESEIRAFLAEPDQGVNYHRGVWHHYSLALGGVSDFLVVDRGGDGENCDEITLQTPLLLNP